MTHHILETETFQVIELLFRIKENSRPDFLRFILLKHRESLLVVITQIIIRRVVSTVFIHHQNPVLSLEFSQVTTTPVSIQPQYILVNPYLPTTQRGRSFLYQRNFVNIILTQHVSLRVTSLDRQTCKIILEHQFLHAWFRFQAYLDHLGLPVRVSTEIQHP